MLTDCVKNKKVAVAVSGGSDSVALLDMLVRASEKNGIKLSVINIDHGIREESKEDSAFVKRLAESYGLPFYGYTVDSPAYAKQNKLSEETAARILRYKVFDEFSDSEVIALAHHMSDQAESILMHILRGSGAKGAVGMKEVNGKYVRPLLDTSKEEIESYVESNGLKFVVDKTNFQNDKTRNFLRNVVFPELKKVNPRVVENICRFGKNIEGDQIALDGLADEQEMEYGDGYVKIDDKTAEKGFAVFSRCAFRAASYLGVNADVESKHLYDIYGLVGKESGSSIDLPYGLKVFRDYDGITFLRGAEQTVSDGEVAFDGESLVFDGSLVELSLSLEENGLYFDADKLPDGCVVRHRRRGDLFCKFGGGTKKLKDFLIDKKIPSRERDSLIVVAKDEEVFIVCGVEISQKIKVDKNSKNIYSITIK